MLYRTVCPSALGTITIICDERSIQYLWMEGQSGLLSTADATITDQPDHPILLLAENWLERYFSGNQPDPLELPLDPQGTPFRQAVWKMLLEIPYGQSATYGSLAKRLGHPRMSAQAVGGAVGHNPISIIIPCHRVLGGDGSLTGYAGGLDKKRWLLDHEGIPYRDGSARNKG